MVAPFIRGAGRLIRRATPSPWPWPGLAGSGGGPLPPRLGARRSAGFGEFIEQPEFESLFPPALPFVGPAAPSAGRVIPSVVVEPASGLPSVRRARPILDPQDVQFVNPRLEPPPPTFPPFRQTVPYAIEPPLRPIASRSFETRVSPSSYVDEYTPLQAADIRLVETAIQEDPVGTAFSAIEMLADSTSIQQFGRSLEVAAIARAGLGFGDEALVAKRALDGAVANAARRFNIPEEVYRPVLYENSPELASEIAEESFTALGTRQDWAARQAGSEKFTVDTNKAIRKVNRVDDLDDYDTKADGVIYRALRAGEVTPEDAARLINQVNYRRILLLKKNGILPSAVKNDVKSNGGQRGIDLLERTIVAGTEGRRAAIYKAAIQTSETPEELSQVYAMMRSDITSPAYLDELESVMDAKTSIIGDIQGVTPSVRPVVGTSTIDEASTVSANRAVMQDEARRALDDETRPAFPSEEVSPEETISRKLVTNPKTGKIEEVVEGGGVNRLIDKSKEASLPPPKNKRPWSMSFGDTPTHPMKPEFAGESTMDLVLSGNRTGTTRASNYNVKVGDVIDFTDSQGRIARVEITKAPYQLPYSSDPDTMQRYRVRWSELEGWDPSLYDQYVGQWQFQYKLLGEITV